MKYILQIFAGTWHAAHDNPEEMIRKIEDISAQIPVDKVIIGCRFESYLSHIENETFMVSFFII